MLRKLVSSNNFRKSVLNGIAERQYKL